MYTCGSKSCHCVESPKRLLFVDGGQREEVWVQVRGRWPGWGVVRRRQLGWGVVRGRTSGVGSGQTVASTGLCRTRLERVPSAQLQGSPPSCSPRSLTLSVALTGVSPSARSLRAGESPAGTVLGSPYHVASSLVRPDLPSLGASHQHKKKGSTGLAQAGPQLEAVAPLIQVHHTRGSAGHGGHTGQV